MRVLGMSSTETLPLRLRRGSTDGWRTMLGEPRDAGPFILRNGLRRGSVDASSLSCTLTGAGRRFRWD